MNGLRIVFLLRSIGMFTEGFFASRRFDVGILTVYGFVLELNAFSMMMEYSSLPSLPSSFLIVFLRRVM
jgi:hypothetical protein